MYFIDEIESACVRCSHLSGNNHSSDHNFYGFVLTIFRLNLSQKWKRIDRKLVPVSKRTEKNMMETIEEIGTYEPIYSNLQHCVRLFCLCDKTVNAYSVEHEYVSNIRMRSIQLPVSLNEANIASVPSTFRSCTSIAVLYVHCMPFIWFSCLVFSSSNYFLVCAANIKQVDIFNAFNQFNEERRPAWYKFSPIDFYIQMLSTLNSLKIE